MFWKNLKKIASFNKKHLIVERLNCWNKSVETKNHAVTFYQNVENLRTWEWTNIKNWQKF